MTTITREQAQKIIEAADEVISALAGTNEDVHPGSDNMLRLWDDLNDRYAPPEVVRELARIALASLEAEPVSQTYNLPELIEGMEVSIDVSTCDADLGNRYFGTVTEALELDTAKNGYILLVQDAEPNFDVNGNSPVIPDGWISCSERMPKKNQNVLISVNFDSDLVEPLICSARNTGSTFRRGQATIKPGNGIEQATHWMPLPEPPQEVRQ
ncbi:DUF551 domain-containing protein [Escherichia coli]|uniref:DUF551 domain-containing protein n=1 Tax=Escherichia coli TaxID=562 RepID=UPI00028C004C|nr:DUF551 domain-containing protein [Escherichia coli]EEW1162255.1 DUF551 domain-containing protein [Escherichia coli O157:H7]EFA8317662.1 DUF551 domain-containing protein [Escherichia coli O157]ELT1996016.1 DUF551 domain-containing protein [Shigella sonnei]ALL93316.1 hypothetical protein AKK22_11065 [Escherichia coli]EED0137448.1 DUF551 domain-containing protein [Escherichia coli]